MDFFSKCNFCRERDTCNAGCFYYEHYKPDKWLIIEIAKKLGIAVMDLIALIEMEDSV